MGHSPSNKLDLTGQKYGRLTVLTTAKQKRKWLSYWLCKCDCGNERVASTGGLRSGQTISCGCSKSEATTKRLTTHGDRHSKEYAAWQNMKSRCYNKKNNRYKIYGKIGRVVCQRWLNSYENFLSDMGRAPTKDHSIERVENKGNYEPSNCVWGTDQEQAINRVTTVWVTFNGETLNLSQWAKRFGINKSALSYWKKRGLTFEAAVNHFSLKKAD